MVGTGFLITAINAQAASASPVQPASVQSLPLGPATIATDTCLPGTSLCAPNLNLGGLFGNNFGPVALPNVGLPALPDPGTIFTDLITFHLVGDGTATNPNAGLLFGNGFSYDATTCTGGTACNGGNGGLLFGSGGNGFNGGNGGNAFVYGSGGNGGGSPRVGFFLTRLRCWAVNFWW